MKHVDPASTEFEDLSRQEQARIYRSIGWTVPALAEEFGVSRPTIRTWLDPEKWAREQARKREYNQTARAKELWRAWYQTPAGREAAARQSASKPRKTDRRNVTPEAKEAIRAAWAQSRSEDSIALEFGISHFTVRKICRGTPSGRLPGRRRKFDHAAAAEFLASGLSLAAVARKMGACEKSVRNAVRRLKEAA